MKDKDLAHNKRSRKAKKARTVISAKWRHPNRRQVQDPTRIQRFWCSFCDEVKVHPGAKCKSCGQRAHTKRLKKAPMLDEEAASWTSKTI